jgi:hypothetical protein
MTTQTKSSNLQIKQRRNRGTYSPGGATVSVNKDALKHVIINRGFSIFDAASRFDIDECKAERILFSNKPTKQQLAFAFEIYDKGLSFLIACVGSGVAPKQFKLALRSRENSKFKLQDEV